jgi:hypothetical protein
MRRTRATVTADHRLPHRFSGDENKVRRLAARAQAKGDTPLVGALAPNLGNILPPPVNPIKAMFLHVAGNAYQVASLEQASHMFCIARDKNGEGASNTPSPLITDAAGGVIAHISYNGRVWPSTAWTVDAMPLYDNRVA